MREPLLLPAVALGAGILAGHFFYFRLQDLSIAAAAGGALAACVFAIGAAKRMRFAAACLVLLLAGLATQAWHRQGRLPKLDVADGEMAVLAGCVINPPVFSPDRAQFTLELAPAVSARITVTMKGGQDLALRYGDRVEATAKIRIPHNYGNPDAFDYRAYLAAQHIYWNGSVASPTDLRVTSGTCGSRAVAWLYGIRTWALGRITNLYPDDLHTAALLKATLLGETSGVDRRWTSDFRATGTYHALVISGQHVSVLAFTILLFLRLLRVRRVPGLCIAAVASWGYAFISGFSSPVVRAAGGLTLFLAATYCFRRTRVLNILAAIGIVYLLFDPDQLFDPSFQLSFLSAAAIAVFALPLMERFTEPLRASIQRFDQVRYDPQVEGRAALWRVELRLLAETLAVWTRLPLGKAQSIVAACVKLAAFVADTVIISASVQFGLALPMVSYFHRLSVTGLSANIVVIPLLSLVVPFGFAAILTGWMPLAVCTRWFLELAERVATWHVKFEPAWRTAAIPLLVSLLFCAALIWLAVIIRIKKQWTAVPLTCSLVLFGVICRQPWKSDLARGMLELTAIDVGQGDSLFLAFPDGETMLVDAGGFPGMERMSRKPQTDIGEDVVSPYLWSRHIRHLDFAALTHGHSDHMAGLGAVLDNFHPAKLLVGAEPESKEWADVRDHARNDAVAIVPMTRAAAPLHVGGAEVRVLAPAPDYVPGDHAANNDSLVLEVSYNKIRFLLTGDAERPVEHDLAASGVLRPVTVLKVGHHGSRTSSSEEFLDAVHPRLAVISDGYLNQFHHPHPDVIKRLADHNAAVFRTDQRGLVTFRTDGNTVTVTTFQ